MFCINYPKADPEFFFKYIKIKIVQILVSSHCTLVFPSRFYNCFILIITVENDWKIDKVIDVEPEPNHCLRPTAILFTSFQIYQYHLQD